MLTIFLIFLLIFIIFIWLTGTRSDSVSCLVGKTAIVTGGNDGIGYAIALLLASRGCKVIIADKAHADQSKENIKKLTKNKNIHTNYLDLSSFAAIRKFVEEIKKSETKVDILINNAGINPFQAYRTEDDLSSIMEVNYLGAFLLTHLLVDRLKNAGGARVVFAGSILSYLHNVCVDNLSGLNDAGEVMPVTFLYGNSKFCNIFAAQEFAKRFKKYDITAYSADPGMILTKIFDVKGANTWLLAFQNMLIFIFGQKPIVGAQTAFHLATTDGLDGESGGHYFLCRPWFKPWKLRDSVFCEQLWDKSEELVRLRPDEKL